MTGSQLHDSAAESAAAANRPSTAANSSAVRRPHSRNEVRVLVDLLFFTGTKGGMESYVRQLYGALAGTPGYRFIGYASRELASQDASWFPGDIIDSGISGESRAAWARGELFVVSRAARRYRADLVHCPANLGPLRCTVPVVLTVHDLLPFVHPEWVPGPYAAALRGLVHAAARTATRILTVSAASQHDLHTFLRIPAGRIQVTHLAGTDPLPAPVPVGTHRREPDHILAVGNRMPHKGFDTALGALARLPAAQRPRLTITGGGRDDPLAPVVERLELTQHVSLRGWMPTEELNTLYRSATLLLFPSRFEGFGLPVLEAMRNGCPVVASDIPVLHEIAGSAAEYFPVGDEPALAQLLDKLLADAGRRSELSQAGLSRSARYTWQATADQTLNVFQLALNDV